LQKTLVTAGLKNATTASVRWLMVFCLSASPTVKVLFGSSEQAIGERERKFMKKKIKYTDEPLGDVRIVDDFLPSPGELAFNEEQVKVTIGLSKNSVDFFKKQAKKHRTPYQKMIRRLLDIYVAHHQKRSTG